MDLGDFDYALPPELIAQHPLPKRDRSRLMVVDRSSGAIRHRSFRDLVEYLRPSGSGASRQGARSGGSDVLVLNDTRVVPARIVGRRATGGTVEALVLSAASEGEWRLLIRPAGRLKPQRAGEASGLKLAPIGGIS